MKRIISFFIGLFISLHFINCDAQEISNREDIIDVDKHKMHFIKKGIHVPTLVLDVGFAESYKDWIPLLDELSQRCRIFCYDRAGYGMSEIGPFPRTCAKAADELKELLDRTNTKGPYILVGHSLGAMNMQMFANKYNSEILGMVLLDPPPLDWIMGNTFPELKIMAEKQTEKFSELAESMRNSDDIDRVNQAKFYLTLASEHREMFLSSSKQIARIESFKDLPLIIIASGKPNPAFGKDAIHFQDFWNNQCKQLAGKSSRGKFLLAAESSHHIHHDNPDIILKSLEELISLYKHE